MLAVDKDEADFFTVVFLFLRIVYAIYKLFEVRQFFSAMVLSFRLNNSS